MKKTMMKTIINEEIVDRELNKLLVEEDKQELAHGDGERKHKEEEKNSKLKLKILNKI